MILKKKKKQNNLKNNKTPIKFERPKKKDIYHVFE